MAGNTNIEARKRAVQKYTGESADADKSLAKVESVRLRVPIGWKNQMQNYVAEHLEYNSVNDMICALIADEIGLDYSRKTTSKTD